MPEPNPHHEQPAATPQEHDHETPERQQDEEAMRGPGHENPRETINPDPGSGDD